MAQPCEEPEPRIPGHFLARGGVHPALTTSARPLSSCADRHLHRPGTPSQTRWPNGFSRGPRISSRVFKAVRPAPSGARAGPTRLCPGCGLAEQLRATGAAPGRSPGTGHAARLWERRGAGRGSGRVFPGSGSGARPGRGVRRPSVSRRPSCDAFLRVALRPKCGFAVSERKVTIKANSPPPPSFAYSSLRSCLSPTIEEREKEKTEQSIASCRLQGLWSQGGLPGVGACGHQLCPPGTRGLSLHGAPAPLGEAWGPRSWPHEDAEPRSEGVPVRAQLPPTITPLRFPLLPAAAH